MLDISKLTAVDDNNEPIVVNPPAGDNPDDGSGKKPDEPIVIQAQSPLLQNLTPVTDEELEEAYKEGLVNLEEDKNDKGEPVAPKKKEEPAQVSDTDVFKGLAGFLKEKQFLSSELENFEGTEEQFIKLLEQEFREGPLQEYKESLPPVVKHLIDNYEEGVPLEDLINVKSNQIKFDSIKEESLEENPDLVKTVLTEYYKETAPKWSKERIEKEVSKKLELGDTEDAIEALKELQTIQKEKETKLVEFSKKERQEAEARAKKQFEDFKNLTFSTKEVIPGIEMTKKEQEEVFKLATTPVGKMGDVPVSKLQAVISDPNNVIKLNWLLHVTKDLTDFSSLEKTFETKANKKIEKVIENSKPDNKVKGAGHTVETTKSLNSIESLKQMFPHLNKK